MKTSTIGLFCSAKRSSQFQGPAKSKGYILENLTNAMVVVGATALVAAGAVGTMVLFDQAISSYQDNKTATVHNSEGHVVGEDSSGGYFTSVVMPDGRGGSTTSQQYVPESYYLKVETSDLEKPVNLDVSESTYSSTHIGQSILFHYKVGGISHKVIGGADGHIQIEPKYKSKY